MWSCNNQHDRVVTYGISTPVRVEEPKIESRVGCYSAGMFAMEERGVYADSGETELEVDRLKMELMLCTETAAAVERDLRIRLNQSEREVIQLRERLHDSESAIHKMRANHESAEAERLAKKKARRSAADSFNRMSQPLGYSNPLSVGHDLDGELDCGNQEEKERALAIGTEAAGDSLCSSDSDNDNEDSLLLQNPLGLNASTFIPVAKKRKISSKLSSDGSLVETKEEHWESMFTLLLRFDAEHKHCNVPQRYKYNLIDGSTPCLGRWLQFQRVLHRKSRMRADRLARMQALADDGKLFWDFNL